MMKSWRQRKKEEGFNSYVGVKSGFQKIIPTCMACVKEFVRISQKILTEEVK